jgi:hydroxyacylglutathione hydrolase
MRVVPVPCLKDNYAYLVVTGGGVAVVDPSEAAPVRAALKREGGALKAIWATHHHPDHVGGNEDLARDPGVGAVVAHESDRGRVPEQTRGVDTGDVVGLDDVSAQCIHIPGHTLGAIAYFIAGPDPVVFTGDTLFAAGCGRLFEGTPAQMHASLGRLAELPKNTRVYCGHEYTESNLRFAAHVEPSNADVKAAQERAKGLRAKGEPTVGTTMEHELAVNPFLRVRSPEIRKTLGIPPTASDVDAFAAIRKAKDEFR